MTVLFRRARRCLPVVLCGSLISVLAAPVAAQNPPAGRELPTVCVAGACSGGVSRWVAPEAGISAPTIVGNRMVIRQDRQRELFNWATFDVADGYSIEFDQAFGAAALALNRVLGTTNPQSFINGAVSAPGEVYVINQNGIVFGPRAQVNVHSLTASTLSLWDDQEFLRDGITGAIARTDPASGTPLPQAAFDEPNGKTTPTGDIDVAAGARITAAEGGRVLLVAPRVTNAGTIETPGGQAVLAAGYDKVYVAASSDPNLRGLVVEVDTGGEATNIGELIAERGNVSMVGLAVNQDGVARATTALNFNGSVRLAARHKTKPGNISTVGGQPTILTESLRTTPDADDPLQEFGASLGAGSVTEVLVENNAEQAIDAAPQALSTIELRGNQIKVGRDAQVVARGGTIDMTARAENDIASAVTVASGARIDVSGTDDTVLPMSANVAELELRGNELADFPQHRDGALRGQNVRFDVRELTFVENSDTTSDDDQYFLPIGNVTAAVTSQRRGLSERLANGGSISIRADNVTFERGSQIDFSGGLVTYEPGVVQTSLLVSEGRVFDVHNADPALTYDAVLPFADVDHARWGVTQRFAVFGETFSFGRFEEGYSVGYDAGTLSIIANDIILAGELNGGIRRGVHQRFAATPLLPGRIRFQTEIPLGGLLQIGALETVGTAVQLIGPDGIRLGAARGEEDIDLVLSGTTLGQAGINRLVVFSQGAVRIGDFALGANGELSASAALDSVIDGAVSVPAGSLAVTTLSPPGLRPALSVTADGSIDLRGQWVNDSTLLNPDGADAPVYTNGGNVALRSRGDLLLAAGSLIDVGAGAWLDVEGVLTSGSAGSVTLASQPDDDVEDVATVLEPGGVIQGFGFNDGATLTLEGSGFLIGGASVDAPADPPAPPRVALAPAVFGRGGITRINLVANSIEDGIEQTLVEFSAGVDVAFSAQSLVVNPDFQDLETGTPIDTVAAPVLLPPEERPATHLSVRTGRAQFASPIANPSIRIGQGAAIRVEPRGSITLDAPDRIVVDGALDAPAGTIALTLRDPGGTAGYRNEGIWLLGGAALTARGSDLTFTNNDGLREGEVLSGGRVTLAAERGALVIAPTASVDVSGTSGTLDVLQATGGLTPAVQAVTVNSAAGSVDLLASETLLPYGALSAHAGGDDAAGGTLNVALTLERRAENSNFGGNLNDLFPEDPRILLVGAGPGFRDAWIDLDADGFNTVFRNAVATDADSLADVDPDNGIHGLGVLDPALVSTGGFTGLSVQVRQSNKGRELGQPFAGLPAEIRLVGDTRLTLGRALRLDAPVLASDGGRASLAAPHIVLGSTNQAFRVADGGARNLFEPIGGSGRLTVNAGTLDLVGFMSLQGFGYGGTVTGSAPVALEAAGDIRLHGLPVPVIRGEQGQLAEIRGAFEALTDISLRAAQIYPTTFSTFDVAVRTHDGRITVSGNGNAVAPPLSAGGDLRLTAGDVDVGGVVLAPLGRIAINAAVTDAAAIETAIANATPGAPFDPEALVQVLPASGNSGRGRVSGEVVNKANLEDSDYALTYNGGSSYTLTRLSDNTTTAIDTGASESFTTATTDGFRLTIRNTGKASAGDSYIVRNDATPVTGNARLAAGSVTSVSGNDLTVPFGNILLGNNWAFTINGVQRTLDEPRIFSSAPSAEALEQRPFNNPDRPWTKSISINAADVVIDAGAELDLSGGGDLIAAEFTPGPGGSRDILGGDDDATAFALVPAADVTISPLDPLLAFDDIPAASLAPELPHVSVGELDLRVTIGAGSPIPAGTYTVMPRGYALLPGAYLVEPEPGLINYQQTAGVTGLDGVPVVTARFGIGGTSVAQQQPIALRVEAREQVLNRAEYTIATANEFYRDRALARDVIVPQLPLDGGQLVVESVNSMRLRGELTPNETGGRSIQVDLLGDSLAVVNSAPAAPGNISIFAGDLAGLGAESVLIGGRRSLAGDALAIDLVATDVNVANDVTLELPELLLGATGTVTVDGDLSARGSVRGVDTVTFTPAADGSPRSRALLRVSADTQVTIEGESAPGGIVNIGSAAALTATGSITLEGSSDVVINGTLAAPGGSISLNTSRISIGAVPGGTAGLVLADLSVLEASELRLRSDSAIDIYGALGTSGATFASLLFDTAAVRGFGTGDAVLTSRDLVLQNSGGAAVDPSGTGTGTLTFAAEQIEFGGGAVAVSGFTRNTFSAPRLIARARTALTTDAALDIDTDLLTSSGAGRLAVDAGGALSVSALGTLPEIYGDDRQTKARRNLDSLGGVFEASAESVRIASHLVLPSGQVNLLARSGNIDITETGVIDVAGVTRTFDVRTVGTEGGTVELAATAGAVVVDTQATLDIAGVALAAGGARAGTLSVNSPAAAFDLPLGAVQAALWSVDGDTLSRVAIDNIALGGVLQVDARSLAAIDYPTLAAGGLVRGLDLRQREGNLALAAAEVLQAGDIALTVDRGTLTVTGTIRADGTDGGTVRLLAGDDITLNGSISAAATAADGAGGSVELASRGGTVTLAGGSQIDVGGRDAASNPTTTGYIRLLAPRTPDNVNVNVAPIQGALAGAARIDVIANRVYADISRIEAVETGDPAQIGLDTLMAHNDAFGGAIAGLLPVLDPGAALGGSLHVLPGIEIRSPAGGDLALDAAWALNAWRAGGEPGLLTLRAARDLNLNADLDDGLQYRDNVDVEVGLQFGAATPLPKVAQLLDSESWSYQLVGGADLASELGGSGDVASANVFAVQSTDPGDVVLEDGIRVRTGSGAIDIRASGDLVYADNAPLVDAAAIYTTGLHTGFGQIGFNEGGLGSAGIAGLLPLFTGLLGFDYGLAIPDASIASVLQAPWFFDAFIPGIGFGEDGGDIRVDVGGNIEGPGSTQLATDWLIVMGGPTGDPELGSGDGLVPTFWTVRYDSFRQNLGTLGGGDINVTAGGSINDLSVVLPTTGRPDSPGFDFVPISRQLFVSTGENNVTVLGGGNLDIRAGADIDGARVMLARGDGVIRAGGRIGAVAGSDLDAIFLLGESRLDVTAGGAINIEAVANYSLLQRPLEFRHQQLSFFGPPVPPLNLTDDTRSFFFTYGSDSALSLTSLSADILLENANEAADPIFADLLGTPSASDQAALLIYPDTFSARALGGSLLINRGFQLYPDSDGSLELLAANDITDLGLVQNELVTLVQSDADPTLLISPESPSNLDPLFGSTFSPGKPRPVDDAQRLAHADEPLHSNDNEASLIVALGGTIGQARQESRGFRLFLAEPGRIIAGRDILNLDFEIQHSDGKHGSLVQAGRDFRFTPSRSLSGTFAEDETSNQGALFTGPGNAVVVAGRDIDLGTSDGIVAVGNLRNFALPEDGADLTVIAGAGTGADYGNFFRLFISELPDNPDAGTAYIQTLLRFLAARQVDALTRPGAPNAAAVRSNAGVGALVGQFDETGEVDAVVVSALGAAVTGDSAEASPASLSPAEARRIYDELDVFRTFIDEFVAVPVPTATDPLDYLRTLRPVARRASGNQPDEFVFSARELDLLQQAAPNFAGQIQAAAPLTSPQQAPAANRSAITFDGSYKVLPLSGADAAGLFADLAAMRAELPTDTNARVDLAGQLGGAMTELLFSELEQNTVGNLQGQFDDFIRGYAAIEAAFPTRTADGQPLERDGSLSMLLSRIHTEASGDVNILVPGGSANTGAAATDSLTKPEDRLGVVAQRTGDVHGFVRDDFLVNASRVFALNGGDIIMWASSGDLDAGRGAKTALAAPPPQVVFDPASGQFVTVFPPEVSGSGIRNFAQPGVSPGDVVLSAPVGVIDAGDAGIGSSGNIFLVAETIRNNTNISTSSGQVVTSEAPPVLATNFTQASSSSSAAGDDANESGAEEASKAAAAAATAFEQPTLSLIRVEVLGFGG